MKLSASLLTVAVGIVPLKKAYSQDLVDTLILRNYNTFSSLLSITGVNSVLAGGTDFTVFSPTDDAFASYAAIFDKYVNNPNIWDRQLQCAVRHHVSQGAVLSSALRVDMTITSIAEENEEIIVVSLNPPSIKVDQGFSVPIITQANILASNGIIHEIDDVLLPSCVAINTNNAEQFFPQASTFLNLLDSADLADRSDVSDGPVTIFAPENDAFSALDSCVLEALEEDTARLTELLEYHMGPANIYSQDIPVGATTRASTLLATTTVDLTRNQARTLLVNNVPVANPDRTIQNGVFHTIEDLLIPPGFSFPRCNIMGTLEAEGRFDTLLALLDAVGLGDLLRTNSDYTIFAPTNAAFAGQSTIFNRYLEDTGTWGRQLRCALRHHISSDVIFSRAFEVDLVIDSQEDEDIVVVSLNPPTIKVDEGFSFPVVTEEDIRASNGVIHEVDDVLLPVCVVVTVVEALAADSSYSTFLSLLGSAGLTSRPTVATGPVTIWAPRNAVFEAIEPCVLEALQDDTARLTELLEFHLSPGNIYSRVGTVDDIPTLLDGDTLTLVRNEEGTIRVNNVRVVDGDKEFNNGVIQTIGGLLVPPGFSFPRCNIVDTLEAEGDYGTLLTVLDSTGLGSRLSGSADYTLFAPVDRAFRPAIFDKFLGNPAIWRRQLECAILHHLSREVVRSRDFEAGKLIITEDPDGEAIVVETLNPLSISLEQGSSRPVVTKDDILASNGVIHQINDVLLPVCVTRGTGDDIFNDFSIFLNLLRLTGIAARPEVAAGPTTIYVPRNRAFGALAPCVIDELIKDMSKLTELLEYHVSLEHVFSEDYPVGETEGIPTLLEGETLTLRKNEDGVFFFNDVRVSNPNEVIRNGVAHALDVMLTPPGFDFPRCNITGTLDAEGDYNTLSSLLDVTGLDDVLDDGRYTVFAPTDEAFEGQTTIFDKFLQDTDLWNRQLQCALLHHVSTDIVRSSDLEVDMIIPTEGRDDIVVGELDPPVIELERGFSLPVITDADIRASNGRIHQINDVLLPVCAVVASSDAMAFFPDVAIFLSLLERVGIADRPQFASGPITAYAPTNEVFEAVEPCVFGKLVDDIPKLTELLEYHISPVNLFSKDYSDDEEIPTLLNGATVVLTKDRDVVRFNDVVAVNPDEVIRNGVIHMIEGLLVPPGFEFPECNIVETLEARGTFTTFLSLLDVTGLTDVLLGDAAYTLPCETDEDTEASTNSTTNLTTSVPVPKCDNNYTIFAPTDEAFAGQAVIFDKYLENVDIWRNHLRCVVLHHMSRGIVTSGDLDLDIEIPSEDQDHEEIIVVKMDPPTIDLKEGFSRPEIAEADIVASNGIIHEIDDVLLPLCVTLSNEFSLERFSDFSIFTELLDLVGLLNVTGEDGPITMYAPPNSIFEDIESCLVDTLFEDRSAPALTELLLYHLSPANVLSNEFPFGVTEGIPTLLEGQNLTLTKDETTGEIFFNGVHANNPDETLRNGAAQIIDGLLLPPNFEFPPCPTPSPTDTLVPPVFAPTPATDSPTSVSGAISISFTTAWAVVMIGFAAL